MNCFKHKQQVKSNEDHFYHKFQVRWTFGEYKLDFSERLHDNLAFYEPKIKEVLTFNGNELDNEDHSEIILLPETKRNEATLFFWKRDGTFLGHVTDIYECAIELQLNDDCLTDVSVKAFKETEEKQSNFNFDTPLSYVSPWIS